MKTVTQRGYRRNRVPGGTYFFTANLQNRDDDTLVTHIDALRFAVRTTLRHHPFHIDAWVVLPDHMHCVWTLPPGDSDFSTRWHEIKTLFSRSRPGDEMRSRSRVKAGERGYWQRRFWEHTVRDDRDYAAHVDYVHLNPVKHGYADHPADWPYCSFTRAVREGVYPPDWSGGGPEPELAGERE